MFNRNMFLEQISIEMHFPVTAQCCPFVSTVESLLDSVCLYEVYHSWISIEYRAMGFWQLWKFGTVHQHWKHMQENKVLQI